MREILFRGKAINRDKGYHRTNYKNGEWVYGLITRLYDEQFENLPAEMTDINGVSGIEVDYKTIGQFTGLHDSTKWEQLTEKEQAEWLENHTANEWNGKKIFEGDIIREQYGCSYDDFRVEFTLGGFNMIYIKTNRGKYAWYGENGEVVGNIHDNPELLNNN